MVVHYVVSSSETPPFFNYSGNPFSGRSIKMVGCFAALCDNGLRCGVCLQAIAPSECSAALPGPPLPPCASATAIGALCAGAGYCGASTSLDNCVGERDVYRRTDCLPPAGLAQRWEGAGDAALAAGAAGHMPAWYDRGGPIIFGLERCAAARHTARGGGLVDAGIAGLFNTGTNLAHSLLRDNCERRGGGGGKVWWQVAWGKHNPPTWRGGHLERWAVRMMPNVNGSTDPLWARQLAVVMVEGPASRGCARSSSPELTRRVPIHPHQVKDPLTWMRSMCRSPYAATFRNMHQPACPSPVRLTRTSVAFAQDLPGRCSSMEIVLRSICIMCIDQHAREPRRRAGHPRPARGARGVRIARPPLVGVVRRVRARALPRGPPPV